MADEQTRTIYAVFDADGTARGFFPDDIWSEERRPVEAVEISQLDWQAMLGDPLARYVNGEVVKGVPPPPPDPPENPLRSIEARLAALEGKK